MQKLNCPICSEQVRAENINVQELVAVCSNCDTVFQFTSPEEKAKRRKVKKPEKLVLKDGQNLEMLFRTNFRLDANQAFITSAFGGIAMTIFAFVVGNEYLVGETNFFAPLIFTLLATFFLYRASLIAYNHTHIVMSEQNVTVSRAPLPSIFNQTQSISLNGVIAIKCEETSISKKEAYDTPRYRVWAETADGNRRTIVNDVTEDYAYFISQKLDEKLQFEMPQDMSRLVDSDLNIDYENDEEVVHKLASQ